MFVEVPGSLIVIRFIFRTRPYERVNSVSRPARHDRRNKRRRPTSLRDDSSAASRTGDPTTGEFHDAVILARFGEVDLDSLGE
jgi:hypothetical protein